jgi:peptidoglycan/LPS O-acetylase OafA/YrhL
MTAVLPAAARRGRVAGLDALRGLAVVLVMAHHALEGVLPGAGVVGVVMFFCLSGYLITGVLTGELERTGRVDLRRFYRRRVHRLVPALLAMLVVLTVVTLALDPLHDRGELARTLLWALTWTGDLPFGHAGEATFHLWTLALEEQFYLVWPGLLVLLGPRRALRVAAVGTGLACLGTAVWFRGAPDAAYSLPTGWAVCFVIGAATRMHAARLAPLRRLAVPALAGLLLLGVVPLRGQLLLYPVGGPVIAALTSVLLLGSHRVRIAGGPARMLVALGTVSYAAYLWDYPLTLWLRPVPGGVVLAVLLALVAAALSWRWIEHRPRAPRAAPA